MRISDIPKPPYRRGTASAEKNLSVFAGSANYLVFMSSMRGGRREWRITSEIAIIEK